ncbi:carbon-nitrogen hydrolase [Aspergillus karnatakaensis]|uniref:carbon-nitrogen hydrolase n=1 Tax=Aspergillus karnatakaensis TaxID=1810916 RepID=UPI003CCDC625
MSSNPRQVTFAAAQLGPIQLSDSRESVLTRMSALLDQAVSQAPPAQVVVFPELAFTTFFPRHFFPDEKELQSYFEPTSPEVPIDQSPNVKPFFDHVKRLGVDVYVGYAEAWTESKTTTYYNSAVYFSGKLGRVLAKYRKVHLPGVFEPFPEPGATQQLEKRYFKNGDRFDAFRVSGLVKGAVKKGTEEKHTAGKGDPIFGMLICNDRRWPEGWRAYGLQGAEVILCGYNTTAYAPQLLGSDLYETKPLSREEAEQEVLYHNRLSLTGNSYMNACFSVNVAKAGEEDGNPLIAGTCIVDPKGYVIAESKTKGDEMVSATVDLSKCRAGKTKTFDLGRHRRVDAYGVLLERAGVEEPELLE